MKSILSEIEDTFIIENKLLRYKAKGIPIKNKKDSIIIKDLLATDKSLNLGLDMRVNIPH